MLITTRAPSTRRMSSASSSAPRAEKTCVSPIFLQRSCAGVPPKTDGKSSGMVIVTGALGSALTEGGLIFVAGAVRPAQTAGGLIHAPARSPTPRQPHRRCSARLIYGTRRLSGVGEAPLGGDDASARLALLLH